LAISILIFFAIHLTVPILNMTSSTTICDFLLTTVCLSCEIRFNIIDDVKIRILVQVAADEICGTNVELILGIVEFVDTGILGVVELILGVVEFVNAAVG
ncbi:11052_t:CDS:1, partial [Dentiscutata heterogama]